MSGSLRGLTAHDRHMLQATVYDPGAVRAKEQEARRLMQAKTDFDLLKEAHRFIRDEEGDAGATTEAGPSSALARPQGKDREYADAIARRYEAGLFKEFALVDLKRYKSGRIALRWRTPDEVVGAIGEETCGSLRCAYHQSDPDHPPPPLSTFELPFAYEEGGVAKEAMVKVVVCARCSKKLRYRPGRKEAEDGDRRSQSASSPREDRRERSSRSDRSRAGSRERRRERSPRGQRRERSESPGERRRRHRRDRGREELSERRSTTGERGERSR